MWSLYGVLKVKKTLESRDIIMTRTHWIAYFASMFTNLIIYECHKFSKIDKFIFKRIRKKRNVVIVFPNNNLKNSYELGKILSANSVILNSSFDEDFLKM